MPCDFQGWVRSGYKPMVCEAKQVTDYTLITIAALLIVLLMLAMEED